MQEDQASTTNSNSDLTLAANPLSSQNQPTSDQNDESPTEEQTTSQATSSPVTANEEVPASDIQDQSSASDTTDTSGASTPITGDDSLDPIKKEVLKKLEPLVGELELNPEEKYRALMMIIQANDNKDLLAEAYAAADKIEDGKTRAQALLSIVNEIEYFKNKETASGQ